MNILLSIEESNLLTVCLSAIIDWRSGAIAAPQLEEILRSFELQKLKVIHNYIAIKTPSLTTELELNQDASNIRNITQDIIDYHNNINEVSRKRLLPESVEIPENLTSQHLSKFILELKLAIDALSAAYFQETGEGGFLGQYYDQHDLVVKYRIVANSQSSLNSAHIPVHVQHMAAHWGSLTDIPASQAEIVVGIARFWIQRLEEEGG